MKKQMQNDLILFITGVYFVYTFAHNAEVVPIFEKYSKHLQFWKKIADLLFFHHISPSSHSSRTGLNIIEGNWD